MMRLSSAAAAALPRALTHRAPRRLLSSLPPPPPGEGSAAAAAASTAAAAASAASTPAAAPASTPSWKKQINWKDDERKTKKEEKRAALRDELRSISGNAMVESIKSGGKPYTTPSGLSLAYSSQSLPASAIHATTLDDQPINLPEDCKDKLATFIAVGFNQQAMDFGDRWVSDLLTVYPQDGSQKDVRLLQLSILNNSLISTLFGSYLTRRLVTSTPESKRSYTALLKQNPFASDEARSTFVAPITPKAAAATAAVNNGAPAVPVLKSSAAPVAAAAPMRNALEVEPGWSVHNTMLTHLLLLDRMGRIRWRAVGPPQEDDLATIRRVIAQLVEEQRKQEFEDALRASKAAAKSANAPQKRR